jgi:hypothetical protein
MAWNGGKQLSAEEILGMKPEDLRSKLDSSATKDDLTAISTKQEEFGTTLSAIQASLAALTKKPETPDPTLEADLNDPTTQMLTDPQGYISRQTQNLANATAATRADLNEMRARSAYPGAFAKYNDELVAGANKFSLDQRSNPTFWDFHIRTFMGDKYIKGETQGSYPSLVGGSSFAVNSSGDPTDPNKGFDPQVAAFLKERGVPLDKAAVVKQMQDNGEPVSIETYAKFRKVS